jgi:hypothetical protein
MRVSGMSVDASEAAAASWVQMAAYDVSVANPRAAYVSFAVFLEPNPSPFWRRLRT